MDPDADQVTKQMRKLEAEEAGILKELREMDERLSSGGPALPSVRPSSKRNWRSVLNSLLAACEKEVREAKGYVVEAGPPIKIARCRRGEAPPRHATFLSRPKNTGVDFTSAVRVKEYTDMIKNPVFLNQIRDRCRTGQYNSAEDYLEDMRLLARNTYAFNKSLEVAWVVEHARLLLEAAEDAVDARKIEFHEAEEGLRMQEAMRRSGKRKRGGSGGYAGESGVGNGVAVKVGSILEIFWEPNRRWYSAKVVGLRGGLSEAEVVYDDDKSREIVDLTQCRWRAVKSDKKGKKDGPPSKKQKKSDSSFDPALLADLATKEEVYELKHDLMRKLDDLRSSILNEVRYVFTRLQKAVENPSAINEVGTTVQEVLDLTKDMKGRIAEEAQTVQELMDNAKRTRQKGEATKHEPALEHDANSGGKKGGEHEEDELARREAGRLENGETEEEGNAGSGDQEENIGEDPGRKAKGKDREDVRERLYGRREMDDGEKRRYQVAEDLGMTSDVDDLDEESPADEKQPRRRGRKDPEEEQSDSG